MNQVYKRIADEVVELNTLSARLGPVLQNFELGLHGLVWIIYGRELTAAPRP